MTTEHIVDAIGDVDEELLADTAVIRQPRPARRRGLRQTRYIAIVCLFLVISIPAFLFVVPLGGSSGGGPGDLTENGYYYSTLFALYRYTPEDGRQFIMPKAFASNWLADDNGLYFTFGRSLYVLPHDTGRIRRLYTAERSIFSLLTDPFHGDQLTLSLHGDARDTGSTIIQLRKDTGEILLHEYMKQETALAYNRTYFPVGDSVYSLERTGDATLLYRDGYPALDDGARIENDPRYFGENLLICYMLTGQNTPRCILASPDGQVTDIPDGRYLAGTDRFLLFIKEYDGQPYDLYRHDIRTGETLLLGADMDIYSIVTDGVWMYTFVPWSARTDCWRLQYDADGTLTGLIPYKIGI